MLDASRAWLALKMLWRERSDSALRILFAALAVAVASMSSVGFFSERVRAALEQESHHLLAADLLIQSDHSIPPEYMRMANSRGLRSAITLQFASMAQAGETAVLTQVKAVSAGYPLRGSVRLRRGNTEAAPHGVPRRGTAWVEPTLAARLGGIGSEIVLGEQRFLIAALLVYEPDRAGEMFNIAPRVMINAADVAATRLLGQGARVRYSLLLAGSKSQIDNYAEQVKPRLARGESLQTVRDARPEIRSALDQANRFLTLAAFVSVVLGAATVALATRLYIERQLDACALLRCFGLRAREVIVLYAVQLLVLGIAASGVGLVAGYAAHFFLARELGALLAQMLPNPGVKPLIAGLAIGLLTLFAASAPVLARIRAVPALRVLRHDLGAIGPLGGFASLSLLAALGALLYWQAADPKLAAIALASIGGIMVTAWLLARGLLQLLGRLAPLAPFGARQAWRGLRRRPGPAAMQIAAFAVGFLALILLTLLHTDLFDRWKARVPPDAPNQFLINIQPEQVGDVQAQLRAQGVRPAGLFPMVRARLIAVNGRLTNPLAYESARSRRLAEREFNLSSVSRIPSHNRLVAGRFDPSVAAWSVESGIAEALGIKLGDRLEYDVGGSRVSAPVMSIREVHWDSFEVNFFVLATPGLLDAFPASYITSFHLPAGSERVVARLVGQFPNITVIDVSSIMAEVERIIARVIAATRFIFYFSLAMGLIVLYAAFSASYRAREAELAMLRVFGAKGRQLMSVELAEFATIGAAAGLVASFGANVSIYFLSSRLFELPYAVNWKISLAAPLIAAVTLALLGVFAAWRLTNRAPLAVLRANL